LVSLNAAAFFSADLDHRAAVVEHFLALPDFGYDLLGGVCVP
jgi:hypothetical protein